MSEWTIERARQTYSIAHWSEGYFDVDARGRIEVQPQGPQGTALALPEVVARGRSERPEAAAAGAFPDILGHRVARGCRPRSPRRWRLGLQRRLHRDLPIKVNQHAAWPANWPRCRGEGFGLEAGSKPELMAVLALARRGGVVVCNGYKDREYIRLALIGRKLGLRRLHRHREAVRAEARHRGSARSWRRAAARRAHAPGVHRRRQVAEHRWRQGQVRPDRRASCWTLSNASRPPASATRSSCCISTWARRCPTCATSPRHARGGALLRRASQARPADPLHGCRRRPRRRLRRHPLAQLLLDQLRPRPVRASIVAPLAEACAEHGLPRRRMLITESGRAMTAHHAVLVANVSEVERIAGGRVPPQRTR
jgi:arginine decarboxylase